MFLSVRRLSSGEITRGVARLVQRVNRQLPSDVSRALEEARGRECLPRAREIMTDLVDNAALASRERIPLCQDTGVAVFYIEWGQQVCLDGASLQEAVDAGVAQGYTEGFLRASVVGDPLIRENTGDNTPALIHLESVPGRQVRIQFVPKGAGSENQSRLCMLTPAAGWSGVKEAVLDTVRRGAASACPPLVVGVGIGGSFDTAPWLAKRALFRPLDERHPDPAWAEREEVLLQAINDLDIGPAGLGGAHTALRVAIETHPCHMASLPVAINLQCHSARRGSIEL